MLRVVILGAGISGLATGWFLRQLFGSEIQLTILEKSQRPGGWIETLQKENFLFEQGPRSCRTQGVGQETLALIEALGLDDQIIVPHSNAKKRYLYCGSAIPANQWKPPGLQCLPQHLWEIPFNSLTRGWLKALWRDWSKPKRQEEDESIETFFFRRIGTSWTETLVDPFVSGIYAGNCSRLSLKSCFPLFDAWEQQHGSLLRAGLRHRSSSADTSSFVQKISQSSMFSFLEGMETLPRALASRLQDCLLLGQSITRLKCEKQGVRIEMSEGVILSADYVISTLPTFALSAILSDHPSIAKKMETLSYATVTSVNVGFHQAVLPYQGFGYLIPSHYQLPVLGCVWDSSVFPQQNQGDQTRLTLMMGGARHPEVASQPQSELFELTQRILRDHLGIRLKPDVMQMKKAEQAIPQFEVGYAAWKNDLKERMQQLAPSLILSGSAWMGVSINDCIAQARQLAQGLAEKLTFNK